MILRTLLALILLAGTAQAAPIRLKDLVEFDGVRSNDLVGYGLVVGLNGTGDGLRNSPFTEEIMANILERLGVNVTVRAVSAAQCRRRPGDGQPAAVCASGQPDRCDGFGHR